MIPLNMLTRFPLFADAPPEAVAALAKRGIEVSFPSAGVIFLTGSKPRGWYVLLEGKVRVVRGSGSRQHVVHTECPGGTLGEVPFFEGSTHAATALAAEPTRCALFTGPELEAAIAESPAVAFLMARRLAARVRHLVQRLDDRSARNVQQRLADFLLCHRARGSRAISIGMTQQAVAEELGTVREVVVRELRALMQRGWIEALGGGRYRIADAEGLRRAAGRR